MTTSVVVRCKRCDRISLPDPEMRWGAATGYQEAVLLRRSGRSGPARKALEGGQIRTRGRKSIRASSRTGLCRESRLDLPRRTLTPARMKVVTTIDPDSVDLDLLAIALEDNSGESSWWVDPRNFEEFAVSRAVPCGRRSRR